MNNPLRYPLSKDYQVRFEDLRIVADGLVRPECVLALSNGRIVAANGGGGYSIVEPDGGVRHVIVCTNTGRKYLPNGIALAKSGQVLFADLGVSIGGIFSISPDGKLGTVVTELDGEPLPPSNFVVNDKDGRLWFTISTRLRPRTAAWNHEVADGYIAVADEKGVRIVADGVGYTNEIAFSPDGEWLYVNETYNQKTSRFPLRPDGTVGAKELVAAYDGADIPDGLTFDAHGGAWITCIASNRLIVLRPDGEKQVVLEDTDEDHAELVARKLRDKTLSQQDMSTAGRSRLQNISSLAFGGPFLKTAYLGCLLGTCIRAFDNPVPGLAPIHWDRNVA
ncbi:SMP-30/gluconolactonase/LRE family protein [Rhizobium sp. 1AS11]|uniref:SMP-30/gluconolactonase/LRE family protein n=1 Tax=Rhizobium acaciae TaxID=2989736 RepID=UPI0022233C3F|nr:SMP-30/gluconolactonase/LRE family protein [Rhizobium acaciae]MCW1411253.1 SMP-30/gluconolactonase/LRE family protein [Rhizobium acaciae]MCW1743335.1 SMP-30/gluconolactonase/LRE family protein [Rhizobium acaciae]